MYRKPPKDYVFRPWAWVVCTIFDLGILVGIYMIANI